MLDKLISALNKEEIRHYKLLSKTIQVNKQRLDVELFNCLKKKGNQNAELAFRAKFYPNAENAYYRLKNRLTGQLNKALLHLHYCADEHHQVLENIELSRIFYKKEAYELSELYLRKAEKKAMALDDYDYLNIIYRELITLSFEVDTLKPEELIEKQRATYQKQLKVKEINNVLAIVKHELRRTQNLRNGSVQINDLLETTIDKYAEDEDVVSSYQFQYSIYQIISQFLLSKQDWQELYDFVKEKIAEFEKSKFFNKNNHEANLQMLTYLVNAAFKKNDLQQSLAHTEELYDQMLKYDQVYYHKYLFFYYQALVLNYSETEPKKAIRILTEIKDDREFVSNPYYVQFILLNLSLLHLGQEQFRSANQAISELLASASFKTFDPSLQTHLKLLQMVISYESETYDELFKSTKREIENIGSKPEKVWIEILNDLAKRKTFVVEKQLAERLLKKMEKHGLMESEFSELYGFNAWLKSKVLQ
jgi:hypothetical protein